MTPRPRSARRLTVHRPTTLLAALCLFPAACAEDPGDATPVETVSRFLDLMDRSRSNAGALEHAYLLLDKNSRKALQRRADQASTLAGREFQPWEMLTQGRFRLHFAPAKRNGMKAEVYGEQASVLITGDKPGQRARVPVVREPDGWKVEIRIPDIVRDPSNRRPTGSAPPAPSHGASPEGAPADEGAPDPEGAPADGTTGESASSH
jgi:hypothetical protein